MHIYSWMHVILHIYIEINILFEFSLKSVVQSKTLQISKVFFQEGKHFDEKCLPMTTRGC